MEEVVVEECVRARCHNSQLRTTAVEIALNVVLTVTRRSLTAFFPLRTIRVVTRVLDRRQSDLPAEEMQNLTLICNNFLMCGRYRLSRRKQLVEEYFDSAPMEDDWNPHTT